MDRNSTPYHPDEHNVKNAVRTQRISNILVAVLEVFPEEMIARVTDGSYKEVSIEINPSIEIDSGDVLFIKKICFNEKKLGVLESDAKIAKFSNLQFPYPYECKICLNFNRFKHQQLFSCFSSLILKCCWQFLKTRGTYVWHEHLYSFQKMITD